VSAAAAVPSALPINRDGIPGDIADLPQWVGWQWEWIADDERWTKVPLNPLTGKHASSTNAITWATLDVALAFARREGSPGVGFVVTPDDPYVGIDLDKCRDPETGDIEPWAVAIIARFNSYAEITPTGTGVRVWIRTETGLLPDGSRGRRKGKVEIYGAHRFFTVTGQRVDGDTP